MWRSVIVNLLILSFFVLRCTAPPRVHKTTAHKKSKHEIHDNEYHRYFAEIIHELQQDPEFKEKVLNLTEEDIKAGKMLQHIDLLDHDVRRKLDEVKRREIDFQHKLIRDKRLVMNKEKRNAWSPIHHENKDTFEQDDLKTLISKHHRLQEGMDKERRKQFKDFLMDKAHKRRVYRKNRTAKEKTEFIKQYNETHHKKHERLHAPGHKVLPGMNKQERQNVSHEFNITRDPTIVNIDGTPMEPPEEPPKEIPRADENNQVVDLDANTSTNTTQLKPVKLTWSDENQDVVHLTGDTIKDYINGTEHALVMFYAPWCSYSKAMKPAFAAAAKIVNTENKTQGVLAAIDCDAYPEMLERYEITEYPTMKYFRKGLDFMKYEDIRDAESFVKFMKTCHKKTGKAWSEEISDVHHLTDKTYHDFLKDKEVLVMFYAPWCGPCTSMQAAYMEAATTLKEDDFPGVLAAIDATQARKLSDGEGVTGYPALRYYSNGKFLESFQDRRTTENLLAFIKKQFEPDGHIPSDSDGARWDNLTSSVIHLTTVTFDAVLPEIPHVLVAYYIKWCKNCLKMRTAFMKSAARLPQIMMIASINCDEHADQCSDQGVTSYPAMKYYASGQFSENYSGKLDADSIVNYMLSKLKEL